MFFILSKFLTLFLMPFFWLVLCLFISFIVKNAKKKQQFLFAAILILFGFGNTYLASKVMKWWEPTPIELKNMPQYDVAIVLGGGITNENKWPYDRVHFDPSADRLLQAIQLYKTKKIQKIMISAGSVSIINGNNEKTEANASLLFLKQIGIPIEDIIIETKSKNTYENAKYSKEKLSVLKLKNGKLLLITSAYHMNRSLACFKKEGIVVDSFPACYQQLNTNFWSFYTLIPDDTAFTMWFDLFHEWFGIFSYKIMGYI